MSKLDIKKITTRFEAVLTSGDNSVHFVVAAQDMTGWSPIGQKEEALRIIGEMIERETDKCQDERNKKMKEDKAKEAEERK